MKKIIFTVAVITAITIFSFNRQSAQNDLSAKDPVRKNNTEKLDKKVRDSNDSPRLMFILNDENGSGKWSPALWWSYQRTSRNAC